MLITIPKPHVDQLSKYYESDEYISHTDNNSGLINKLYQYVKSISIRQKVNLINLENKGAGNLLDIGAGTGDFLYGAEEKGWKIHGVEPNKRASDVARQKGINLENSLDKFNNQTFDVITLWHVLEHLPNLDDSINRINGLLKKDGTLIIAVPNYKSFDAKYYKEYWAAYDVPRHFWHFSKKSIEKIFCNEYKLKKIKPMYFDSFYVSLISEKYKSGLKFSIKAIFIGLLSNIRGIFTREYSSHIYILKKL
ncbi:class I SAM-dependent methyltransferase [Aequorivita echinoideorum]|uniref:Class I SAM-dependent methyltransferase n=2 Tax=Aequorivita echinoideorum TaxID=1549647 RepID=A0ABS5S1Q9_9FLAO|nr:class I SAM-dependent methyltransferase [Aequorivita echinoideorum]